MGFGRSNDMNTHGPSFKLAQILPLTTPNPSYFLSPRTTDIVTTSTNITATTCTNPGITFHLLAPNPHMGGDQNMGTGKGVQEEETFLVGGGGTNAYNNITNYSTSTTTTPTPSLRWNPTPEQLLALEEMYRRGIRTPSAEQIQQIAGELLRFGKIEGKNVFYWFQNHKARERQKRRREGENSTKLQKQDVGKRESGIRRSTDHDQPQHPKDLVASSNCKRNTEGLVPIQRQASSAKGERITHGWSLQQFQELRELELQQQQQEEKSQLANSDTWQNGFSFPPPLMSHNSFSSSAPNYLSNCTTLEKIEERETQTLQLFPLGNTTTNDGDYECMVKTHKRDKEVADVTSTINIITTKSSPSQFFEFLPLKN